MSFFAYQNQIQVNKIFKKLAKSKHFFVKYIFLIISFLVLFVSIFWVNFWKENYGNEKKWIDIVFVLDVSKSMNVADIMSNNYSYLRLDFAKKAIEDFVSKNPENRYSLVIFSWDAVSSIPLTNDLNIFLSVLSNVDYRNLTIQWTDFIKAFQLWTDRLKYTEDKSKALIFISDWWDEDYVFDGKVLQSMKDENIEYFIAWIWTEEWWRIITWRDAFWRLTYQTYNWEYVISKINQTNLSKITDIFGWTYLKLTHYWDINDFSNKIDSIEKKVIENNSLVEKTDISRRLAFISFIFFIIYLFMYFKKNWELRTKN